MLLTTHYLEEADRLASQLAIVDRGRVVVAGTPEELKSELHGDTLVVELARVRERAALCRRSTGSTACTSPRSTAASCAHAPTRERGPCPRSSQRSRRPASPVAAVTVARPSLDDVYLRYAGRTFEEDRRG